MTAASAATGNALHPAYFETCFERQDDGDDWPAEFAIVTAYATTGESWPDEENQAADRQLEVELRRLGNWMRRLTGYSPTTGHRESGWAVAMDFQVACDLGRRYQQDALYYVSGDVLFVSFCDERRGLVKIGRFRPRIHLAA